MKLHLSISQIFILYLYKYIKKIHDRSYLHIFFLKRGQKKNDLKLHAHKKWNDLTVSKNLFAGWNKTNFRVNHYNASYKYFYVFDTCGNHMDDCFSLLAIEIWQKLRFFPQMHGKTFAPKNRYWKKKNVLKKLQTFCCN